MQDARATKMDDYGVSMLTTRLVDLAGVASSTDSKIQELFYSTSQWRSTCLATRFDPQMFNDLWGKSINSIVHGNQHWLFQNASLIRCKQIKQHLRWRCSHEKTVKI